MMKKLISILVVMVLVSMGISSTAIAEDIDHAVVAVCVDCYNVDGDLYAYVCEDNNGDVWEFLAEEGDFDLLDVLVLLMTTEDEIIDVIYIDYIDE